MYFDPTAVSRTSPWRSMHESWKTDKERVLNLPWRELPIEPEDNVLPWRERKISVMHEVRKEKGTLVLKTLQERTLYTAREAGGLMAFAGTGSGKSWVALLLGSIIPNVTRVLLYAPAATLTNLRKQHAKIAPHFRVPGPQILKILSYESTQRPTPEGQLDAIMEAVIANDGNPATTIIVLDEGHALKNIDDSARARRFMRCLQGFLELRVFVLSGSLTDTGLTDYAHLAWAALRELSPVPCRWLYPSSAPPSVVDLARAHGNDADALCGRWGQCLDKDGRPSGADWGDFHDLWKWAYPDDMKMSMYEGSTRVLMGRRALQHRLRLTPGVILSTDTSAQEVALVLHGFAPDIPDEVQAAVDAVQGESTTPDGDTLPDAVAVWRVTRQLYQGFYYVWDWPVGKDGKPNKDDAWLLARAAWNSAVRYQIKDHARTGYDSEFLVYAKVMHQIRDRYASTDLLRAWLAFVSRAHTDESPGSISGREHKRFEEWVEAGGSADAFNECEEHFYKAVGVKNQLERAWLNWSSRQKHKRQPPQKTIWISPFLVDAAIAHARKVEKDEGKPCIIWYGDRAVGELLAARGIPVYGAGTNPPAQARLIGAAIMSHREGKDMFQWARQIVVCPPAGSLVWEQLLARTHRTGQEEQVVRCWVASHAPEFKEALASARAGAEYTESVTGAGQKLLHATLQDLKLPKTATERLAELEKKEAEAAQAAEENEE